MAVFQRVIAQQSVECVVLQRRNGIARGRAGDDLVALALEDHSVREQHGGLVVHHQDFVSAVLGHGLVTGKSIWKTVPFPGRLRTKILPSWLCTIPFTIQSPRPVPFSPLVVTNGSKMSLMISDA